MCHCKRRRQEEEEEEEEGEEILLLQWNPFPRYQIKLDQCDPIIQVKARRESGEMRVMVFLASFAHSPLMPALLFN